MRTVETFILRLLIDTDDPHALRGALRAVADDEERPFAGERALVALLLQACLAKQRELGCSGLGETTLDGSDACPSQ
ncbi:MAG: hypothetical protein ACUVXG_00125 [Anaerolineae bacterium]